MIIRHILCPIDFSETSADALDQAGQLATWYRARVTALHVASPPEARVETPFDADLRVRPPQPTEWQLLCDRAATFSHRSSATGVPVDVRVVSGDPVAVILEHIPRLGADLVVMGTHGLSGFQHLVLGSVAEKILRRAPCPVLTVPPRAHRTSMLPFKQILCAVDFSTPSLEGAGVAASLAAEAGARLVLMHVLEWPWREPPAPSLDEMPPEQAKALGEYRLHAEAGATRRLASIAASAMPDQTAATVRVVHGKPYERLLDAAQQERVDLIVAGVHGRNPLDLALFGSTANHLVRAAPCPVLTVRR